MDAKLTLKFDQDVIELAKIYAKEQHQSLSRLVESQLRPLVENIKPKKKKEKFDIENMKLGPIVTRLSGILDLPADFDYKAEYGKYLEEKYNAI